MIYATSLRARSANAIAGIAVAQQAALQAQNDLSSGTRVSVGSDDPVAAASALRLQAAKARLGTYTDNIDYATNRQDAMSSALQDVSDIFTEARTVALSGASSATTTDDMLESLAAQIDSLIDRLGTLANSEDAGSYLFGGTATDSPPFTIDSDSVTYTGTGSDQTLRVSSTLTTETALAGSSIFLTPTNAFTTLTNLRDALRAGDSSAVGATVDAIDQVSASVNKAVSTVGSSSREISAISSVISGLSASIDGELSDAVDTDMAEAAVRLSAANVAYQAALSVTSKMFSTSLLDFL